MMARSDDLHGRGEMLESLADVLLAAGDADGGHAALEEARALFEEKGCTVCAVRTRDLFPALRRRAACEVGF